MDENGMYNAVFHVCAMEEVDASLFGDGICEFWCS